MPPITDVREISRIGYGFMASRALFAALDVDVFGRLAEGPKTLETLAADLGLTAGRLRALLTACVGLGLLTLEGDRYANAPASATYLVRTSPAYFGDYFRFQVSRQIYPTLMHLDGALRGEIDQVENTPILNDNFEASVPGLYFLGLRRTYAVSSALLSGVGNDAAFIAEHISTRQG